MGGKLEIASYCALCVSRCGAIATVEDGRLLALKPDPEHPTGQALCIKGRVAPEIVYSKDRLLYPLKRTRPKGASDPGWQRIGWSEALTSVATSLLRLADRFGPETVVFSAASSSPTALSDSQHWIQRLRRAFGSPNLIGSMELCGWGRLLAPTYTFGAAVPGAYMPDLERAGCIMYWGYNPTVARIAHATQSVSARKRGAKLLVVDPRRVGLARQADLWLRVRPGTDAALALAIAHIMIERGWFDEEFVRRWTNAPLLVRIDNGRLLRERDLSPDGSPTKFVAWDPARARPVPYDPATRSFQGNVSALALFGDISVSTAHADIPCTPVFDRLASVCRPFRGSHVESVCGVGYTDVEAAARLLWESRPVAYYAWSGVEQHTNATQSARALGALYALTGSIDAPGGNVLFPSVRSNAVEGEELLSPTQRAKALGLAVRPLGPSRWEWVTSDEFYTAALEHKPYRVSGLVGFGANLLMAQADSRRGREALAALEFYAHADLFMNPTAEMADIVLPVTSPFESEGLKIGFEVNESAQSLIQLRKRLVEPRGESRSDTEIIFGLARALGLGNRFWNGDVDAGLRYRLEPSGVSLEQLRARPEGIRVPLDTRYRKYAEEQAGVPRGFATPTGKVELYSETLLEHGYDPLPGFVEPMVSPRSRPELARRYPLILTCAKDSLYCESQHRNIPSLRKRGLEPFVEMHPESAAERGIDDGDWVTISTPHAAVRARARLNHDLDRNVACGQHGWWQACEELNAPGYAPFGPEGSNLNLVINHEATDPVSGSVPHRSYVCQIERTRG